MAVYPNYYYPNGYQPTQPQIMTAQPHSNSSNGVIWVQGEAGAKAYPVAAGNSVLMMDIESPTVYMKTVEANGMPQPLKVYDLIEKTPRNAPNSSPNDESVYVTKKEFEAFRAQIMADISEAKKKEEHGDG